MTAKEQIPFCPFLQCTSLLSKKLEGIKGDVLAPYSLAASHIASQFCTCYCLRQFLITPQVSELCQFIWKLNGAPKCGRLVYTPSLISSPSLLMVSNVEVRFSMISLRRYLVPVSINSIRSGHVRRWEHHNQNQ